MFYLNSQDQSLIPDTLFFLQKIGLLKHRVAEGLAEDSLYFIEKNVPLKIYTIDSVSEMRGTQNTVLVFDFLLGTFKNLLRDQNVVVIPHVYFDYVTTIKDLAEFKGLNSFKIYSPETSNTLIPKKHLKITLPFLKDHDFVTYMGKLIEGPKKTPSNFSIISSIRWLTKTVLSALLVFCIKPFVQTKLFFAKYNIRYIAGQTRLFLIKSFYFIFNLRFDVRRLWFRLKQSRYVFYTYTPRFIWGKVWLLCVASYFKILHFFRMSIIRLYWGAKRAIKSVEVFFRYQPMAFWGFIRLAFIRAFYVLVNLRFSVGEIRLALIRGFYFFFNLRFMRHTVFNWIQNLRFPIMHAANSFIIFIRHAPLQALGSVRVFFIKLTYTIMNLRYPVSHFIDKIYTFFRYAPPFCFGALRVGLIRLFYTIANLRFPIWKNLCVFYWINHKYTFYPIRKLSWIIEYQIQKRILKTNDFSKH